MTGIAATTTWRGRAEEMSTMAKGKMLELLPAKPGIATSFFHDEWRHPHSTWGLTIKSVRGFSQGHRIDTPHLPADQNRFEGMGEIWFDTVEDVRRMSELPVFKQRMEPDAAQFVDADNLVSTWTEEEVLQSTPPEDEATDNADSVWREDRRPVSIKLVQMIEADGERPWIGDDDLALGRRIGALRHVRTHVDRNVRLKEGGIEALPIGFRELWWPTRSAFNKGVAADPEALALLLDRPARGYAGLFVAERYPF